MPTFGNPVATPPPGVSPQETIALLLSLLNLSQDSRDRNFQREMAMRADRRSAEQLLLAQGESRRADVQSRASVAATEEGTKSSEISRAERGSQEAVISRQAARTNVEADLDLIIADARAAIDQRRLGAGYTFFPEEGEDPLEAGRERYGPAVEYVKDGDIEKFADAIVRDVEDRVGSALALAREQSAERSRIDPTSATPDEDILSSAENAVIRALGPLAAADEALGLALEDRISMRGIPGIEAEAEPNEVFQRLHRRRMADERWSEAGGESYQEFEGRADKVLRGRRIRDAGGYEKYLSKLIGMDVPEGIEEKADTPAKKKLLELIESDGIPDHRARLAVKLISEGPDALKSKYDYDQKGTVFRVDADPGAGVPGVKSKPWGQASALTPGEGQQFRDRFYEDVLQQLINPSPRAPASEVQALQGVGATSSAGGPDALRVLAGEASPSGSIPAGAVPGMGSLRNDVSGQQPQFGGGQPASGLESFWPQQGMEASPDPWGGLAGSPSAQNAAFQAGFTAGIQALTGMGGPQAAPAPFPAPGALAGSPGARMVDVTPQQPQFGPYGDQELAGGLEALLGRASPAAPAAMAGMGGPDLPEPVARALLGFMLAPRR